MTKKLSECTPEEAERLRKQTAAYREKTRDAKRAYGSAYHKRKYAEDPAYRARKDRQANEARFRRIYGISTADRDKMLEQQNGMCAICKTTKPGGRGWHTDHCHSTGKVRGMLCTACNVFVGRIEKNPLRLRQAVNYIEDHRD